MSSCYNCDKKLTNANASREHLFNNSIGGRLKSKKLLCVDCNSTFGSNLDTAVSESFNTLAHMFNIKRERGDIPDIEAVEVETGEEILIDRNGKPKLKKPKVNISTVEKKTQISVTARDLEEAKRILGGMRKKFPGKEDEFDKILENIKPQERSSGELKLSMNFGGDDLFRAITKIAINYWVHCGGDRNIVKRVLPFVQGKIFEEVCWHFYPGDDVFQYSDKHVCHSIVIVGNNKEKIAYGIVDIFSTAQYIVFLSSNYSGRNFRSCYSFDLASLKQIHIDGMKSFTKREIEEVFKVKNSHFDEISTRVSRFMAIADRKRSSEKRMEELFQPAWDSTIGALGEGAIITPEAMDAFIHTFTEALMPDIQRASETRRKRAEEEFLKNIHGKKRN